MATGIGAGISPVFDLKPGTPAPAPACTTDYSLAFDGLTEYGDITSGGPVLGTNGSGSFTITLWLKAVTGASFWIINAGGATGSLQGNYAFRVLPNSVLSFRSAGGTGVSGNVNVGGVSISNNTWELVSLVIDTPNKTGVFYNNITPGPVSNLGLRDVIFTANPNWELGRTTLGGYLKGNICHFAIWNDALTASQIGELYGNTGAKCYASDFSFSSKLQNYYPTFNPTGTYTDPLTDIVSGLNIKLVNMSATNVSTEHPSQL